MKRVNDLNTGTWATCLLVFRFSDAILYAWNSDPELYPLMTSVYGLGATIIKLHQYMIFSPALSHLNVTGYWIVRVPLPSLLIRQSTNSIFFKPTICSGESGLCFAPQFFGLITIHTEHSH
jgi:hypothetical protein